MLKYVSGNIFESGADCLVNPVNCVGIMGKGLAKEFKHRYPDMFVKYIELCKAGQLQVGQVAFYANKRRPNKVICLFPTKDHWQNPSTIAIIDESLKTFVKYVPDVKIKSVAFPMIGCGLGGLAFEHQVKPLMERYLGTLEMDVEIYVDPEFLITTE